MQKKIFTILILYVLFASQLFTQTNSKIERTQLLHQQARIALSEGDIDKGIVLHKKMIQQNKRQMHYYWLLDDIYKQIHYHQQRIDLLNKAIKIKKADFPAETKERLGLAYADMGLYDNAIAIFLQLKQTSTIKQHINRCIKAKEIRNNPIDISVENMGESINSIFDNIWPSITADDELFSVTVVEGKRNPFANPYTIQEDIYQSVWQNGTWQQSKRLAFPINTKENEGAQRFSADGRYMFFVACHRKDGEGSCDIYYSIINGGVYSSPINPGKPLNTSFWESTPSFSACGKHLYFSSNRHGGFGGKDIWRCDVEILPSGKLNFSNAINLGKNINTPFDEIAPFIHADNQHLYFSSNGHLGLGEFDIFYAKKDSNGIFDTITNIGYPINSFGNDIGFVVSASGKNAFLSSNHQKGFSHLNQQIYKIGLPVNLQPNSMKTIKGNVIDGKTKQALQAIVAVWDINTNNIVSQTISDSKNGEFTAIIPDSLVGISVDLKGYLPYSERIEHVENGNIISLIKSEKGAIFTLRNIYFEFDSATLLPNSYPDLQRLITYLLQNAAIKISISGHTDNMGSDAYNLALSTQRARAVYNYLIENGIHANRLSFVGKGAEYPISENETEQGRSKNRRIEFEILP